MADIPQTSASERVEKARQFLDRMGMRREIIGRREETTFEAEAFAIIEGLVTPPSVGESEEAIADRIVTNFPPPYAPSLGYTYGEMVELSITSIRAGIQSAHETWEPADHPSQEMMLRWLGIDYEEHREGLLFIPEQSIEREEI